MDPFLGSILIAAFNFAPLDWATCDGQTLSITQNTALFSLLGTNFGGDGRTTFALPDLRGRVAIHQGQGPGTSPYIIGQTGGVESVTLSTGQIPVHQHNFNVASGPGTSSSPGGTVYLAQGSVNGSGPNATLTKMFTSNTPSANLGPLTITGGGGNQSHENRQPYLCLIHIIALQGIFPSRA